MAKEEKKPAGPKMTYEQLLKAAQDLNAKNNYLAQQNQQLMQKLQELSDFSMFKRLDYLFKVAELRDAFPAEFVKNCTDEIVATMTLPPAEEPKDENPENKGE